MEAHCGVMANIECEQGRLNGKILYFRVNLPTKAFMMRHLLMSNLLLKASFHMIADDRRSQIANNRRRSQERLFPYNRNDRRATVAIHFGQQKMPNIHERVG